MSANIQLALWVAHPVLELCLAGVMFWRRLHRTFPIFFAYVVFQVVNFLVLFPIYRSNAIMAYFYAYWISAAISLAIGFKVIHEIFLDVFRPYHTLKDLGTVLFKWAALVMLLVAMVVTAASPAGGDTPLAQAVIIGQRCVRVIQCGLILFLLVFFQVPGSFLAAAQLRPGSRTGWIRYGRFDWTGSVFGRTDPSAHGEPGQYDDLQCRHSCLDCVCLGETGVPRTICQPADVNALGPGS
jgi:hypothetical protein